MIELFGTREQITAAIEAAGGEIDADGRVTVLGSATLHGIEFTDAGANLYTTDREFAAQVEEGPPAA